MPPTSPSRDAFKEFGSFLKTRRLKKNLTQKEVSEVLRYDSAQFLSNVERGVCSLPLAKIPVVMDLYGIDVRAMTDALLKIQRKIITHTIQRSQVSLSKKKTFKR